jgi:hypothetical protein
LPMTAVFERKPWRLSSLVTPRHTHRSDRHHRVDWGNTQRLSRALLDRAFRNVDT